MRQLRAGHSRKEILGSAGESCDFVRHDCADDEDEIVASRGKPRVQLDGHVLRHQAARERGDLVARKRPERQQLGRLIQWWSKISPSSGIAAWPAPTLARFSAWLIGGCVPCATSASNAPAPLPASSSEIIGKSKSVLSSRVLSGMTASTRAPARTPASACRTVSRSSAGVRMPTPGGAAIPAPIIRLTPAAQDRDAAREGAQSRARQDTRTPR